VLSFAVPGDKGYPDPGKLQQKSPDKVPETVHDFYVSMHIPPKLDKCANAVHKKTDGPYNLVWFPPGQVLVKDDYGENKAYNAGS
jgi:hypothetical protein